jgi:predicted Zn-dependent protease
METCPRCLGLYLRRRPGPVPVTFCHSCTHPFPAARQETLCRPCFRGRAPRDLPEPAEHRLGELLGAGLSRTHQVARIPGTESYVARVLDRLARVARVGSGTLHILLLDESRPAAHALPGNRVTLTLGLLATLRDEAELAFVLAHEVAHLESGEVRRRTASRGGARWPSGWWRRLTGHRRAEQRRLERLYRHVFPLGYGPEAELAADIRAVELMVQAGYDPWATLRYLTHLEGKGAESPGESHLAPAPAVRKEKVARVLARLPRPEAPSLVNKEVFRRAVGGFEVFTRRTPRSA